jgi:hypothetical protein
MSIARLSAAALLVAAASVTFAAPEQYPYRDHSSPALIDADSALKIWRAQADDSQRQRIQKLYPPSNWGFISQVQGGFTPEKTCVVTARTMLVPRMRGDRLEFKPKASATTFAAQPGATNDQCRELAAAKLKEAVLAIRSSLIAP